LLTRYRTWRVDRVDRKQRRCSHEHLSRSSDGWYWYRRGYKANDGRYGTERYGCLRCGDCGAYKPCSPPVFDPGLECQCFLPIKDAELYFGALRCRDCDALIPCLHEHTVVYGHQYAFSVFAPRLECPDCGMPLQDPDMYGKDGAICSYGGHPEYDNTYRTATMNPGLRPDG
jgi:hypothetical protein